MNDFSTAEKKILTQMQRGVEIISRPFQSLELPEAAVLMLLQRAQADGLLRRFGGVFDARRLGYKSILCAVDVPPDQIEQKAAVISAHPGVTHCYERTPYRGEGRYPKLWFTLAMLRDEFEQGIAALKEALDPLHSTLYELPAIRRFKIDVVFDLQATAPGEPDAGRGPQVTDDESSREFSGDEQALVRALDQQLPLVARPFAAVAEQVGKSEAFVLSALRNLKEQGVLRRIGAVLYHREAGFTANAMCVWPVSGSITEAGRRVAARPEVTHCYQRPRLDAFPFDLYAMIHTGSWNETEALFQSISSSCGLNGGELFASGREFKKTSMKYFR